MPCYNEPAEVFRRSLESVIHQTLKEIEIIIILDNPENTELENIIWEYQRKYKNILLLSPKINLWRWNARNLWVTFAEGKYIAIHDADDIDVPERLQEQFEYMEKNSDVGVLFSSVVNVDSNWDFVNESTSLEKKGINTDSFFWRNMNHATMFVRREVMKEYGNSEYGEDYEIWIRFFRDGIKMGHTEVVHTKYLAPSFSTHSDFVKKMKTRKITGIKVLLSHNKVFYHDPYFYIAFCIMVSEYISLLFGGKTYISYRKLLQNIINSRYNNKIKK